MANPRIIGTLMTVTLFLGVFGCTTPPTPTPTPSTATPSATPTTPAPSDLESAKQAVVHLWKVVDRLTNDPKSSIQDLDAVAGGQTLTMFQENLVKYRANNFVGSGSSVVEDLEASADGINAEGRSSWTVTACVDGSKTELVDAEGRSVQGPPYRIRHESTVEERSSGFFVVADEAVGTC